MAKEDDELDVILHWRCCAPHSNADMAIDKDKYTDAHHLTQADPDDMAAFTRRQPTAPF